MRRTVVLAAAAVMLLSGCTAGGSGQKTDADKDKGLPLGAFRLVAFDTCENLLTELRRAAKTSVTPWGFGRGYDLALPEASGQGTARDGAAVPPGGATQDRKAVEPDYSGTNTHEAGVDEPDLVKTDGRRIVTLLDGVLRVVDVSGRMVSGVLTLAGTDARARYAYSSMLLAGDRVLLIGHGYGGPLDSTTIVDGDYRLPGTRLTLVDISRTPRIVSDYGTDGMLVDARQIDSVARVVVSSTPRVRFPMPPNGTDANRLALNQQAIDAAPLGDWLPRYSTVDKNGKRTEGQVPCTDVSRPAEYSGASLLTVLTFDLGHDELGTGDPVSVAADGETVYANGPSLYVANDQRWRAIPFNGIRRGPVVEPRTDLYKFDIAGRGKPAFVAAGSVNGWLLNQYSMSEWDGYLRVATTDAAQANQTTQGRTTESSVSVLRTDGRQLVETGRVGGLGKGERIYSVRFVGTTGYVVTFRQTDPLYTVDLRDPGRPKVTGELKITGYSAYLHPAGENRLIGIGQEASAQGRVQGTQISLFDVGDPAAPRRLAQYHVEGAYSQAEYDPHAFLYWPKTGLLAVPMSSKGGRSVPGTGLIVLSVKDTSLAQVGTVEHPAAANTRYVYIQRSLVIDQTLWTVSGAGVKASDLRTLTDTAWIAYN